MKTFLVLTAILASALVSNSALAQFNNFNSRTPGVIYGDDDRREVFQVTNPQILAVADATVAVVEKKSLVAGAAFHRMLGNVKVVKLEAPVYGAEYGLCKQEPYYNQPSGAFCSGFLIGPDLVATAGHCIDAQKCSTVAFAFGYQMNPNNTPNVIFPQSEVYGCKKVVARELTNNQDYAVVQLDRPVPNHQPLKLAVRQPQAKEPIYVIGHPAGLPKKIAAGANVRALNKGYFSANLDTYGGNSGSAVFSAVTNEVLGILVRGENDFNSVNGCRLSNQCKNDQCRGEDITYIQYVINGARQGMNRRVF